MRYLTFVGIGLVLALLQANTFRFLGFLPHPGLYPSLVLPLIVYLGVHEYPIAPSAGVAFALGYASDLGGIAPVGLYTFAAVATFLLARSVGVRLAAHTVMTQAALAAGFCLLHGFLVLILVTIFGPDRDAWVPRRLYPVVGYNAFSTGLVGPFVFRLVNRIEAAVGPRSPEVHGSAS